MASFIGGPVLQGITGYNPVYFYADSAEKAREGFRYTLHVERFNPGPNTFTTMAELEIKPRFGDGLMEVDLAKVLQSQLGISPDSFDINSTNQIWLSGQASGYEYRITLGERYLYTWQAAAWGTQNGNLTLIDDSANPAPLYQPGDIISITGVTEEFEYTSITDDAGLAQFNFTGAHTFQIGDAVNVRQDSPVSFLAYSIPSTVTAVGATSITVNIPFAGTPYQTQTGKAYRNFRADGFHPVISVTVSAPFRLIELDFTGYDGFSSVTPVETSYADGRLFSNLNQDVTGGAVWNGAVGHAEWPEFPFQDYWSFAQPTGEQRFLTTAPDGFCVRPENDMYLNYFTRGDGSYERVRVRTYDDQDQLTGTYWYDRDNPDYGDYSVSAFHLGASANEYPVQVLSNTGFLDPNAWVMTEVLGAVGTFTGPGFNYLDNTGTGDGSVYLVEAGVLIPGNEYTVTIELLNNNFTQVMIGDENDTYQIANNQNGTFSLDFTATGTDFWIELNSAGGVTQGVDIISVKAKTLVTDAISCDDARFDVALTREALVNIIQGGRFETGDEQFWTITNQLDGFAQITGGQLVYQDLGVGDGSSLVVQAGALTPGVFYTVTIDSSSNTFTQVLVGDENDTYQILNQQDGTFSVGFTATGTDFYIEINSVAGIGGAELDNLTVRTLADQERSETRSFSICCECQPRYENVEMLFVDRLGSVLPFNFSLNHRRRLNNIKRDTIRKQIGGYQPGQIFGRYTYSPAEHSDMAYSTEATQQWDVNTNWMDEETSKYFEEVIATSRAWARVNGKWRAVWITDRVHDIKRKNNQKMINYRLTFQFSSNDPIQSA